MSKTHTRLVLGLTATALCLTGCAGGSSDTAQPGGGADAAPAPAAPEAGQATGEATFCVGKDTTGAITAAIELFNGANPDAQVTLLELPEATDEARAQLVQRQRAESAECDVLGMDVVWVAEFAAQGWLADVTETVEQTQDSYIPSTIASARYDERYWGLPYVTDTGFLYYRTDKVAQAPTSWEQVYAAAGSSGGLVYQGAKGEGLTCNYLELLFGAGGSVLSEDGAEVLVDSPQARKALDLMVSGLQGGAVEQTVLTYQEEESRRAFEGDRAALMRNWPYAYALGQESAIAGNFAAAPVPGFEGSTGASVLGGYNLGVSAYSDDQETALAFAVFMGEEEAQRLAGERALPPARTAAYDDPAVRAAIPFADVLREAVGQAQPRPVSPVYPQISEAIQTHVYAALQGEESTDQAVTAMAADITEALETF